MESIDMDKLKVTEKDGAATVNKEMMDTVILISVQISEVAETLEGKDGYGHNLTEVLRTVPKEQLQDDAKDETVKQLKKRIEVVCSWADGQNRLADATFAEGRLGRKESKGSIGKRHQPAYAKE